MNSIDYWKKNVEVSNCNVDLCICPFNTITFNSLGFVEFEALLLYTIKTCLSSRWDELTLLFLCNISVAGKMFCSEVYFVWYSLSHFTFYCFSDAPFSSLYL